MSTVYRRNASTLTGNIDATDEDIERELDDAPDPVWPGMPRREFRRLGRHLREVADRLGLRDWIFHLAWEPTEHEDACASIVVSFGRRNATVSFDRGFATFDDETKHQVIVHELLHCHLDILESLSRSALCDLLGKPTYSLWEAAQHERIEHVTDNLAEVLARWLPPLERVRNSDEGASEWASSSPPPCM